MSTDNSPVTAKKTISYTFPQEIPFAVDQKWVEFYVTNRSRFTIHFKIIPFLFKEFHVTPATGCVEPRETSLVRITRISGAKWEVKYRGNISMSARSRVALWEEKHVPPIEQTAVKELVQSDSSHGLAEEITTKMEKETTKTKADIISVSPQELITAPDKNWVKFKVQNHSRYPVAFKIRGSRVEEFSAKPATGYIEPDKYETVRIMRIRDPLHPPCSCERFVRFSVLAKEVTGDDAISPHDLWESPNGECQKIVKCQFARRKDDKMNRCRKPMLCENMNEALLRIKNWLRALNAILLGLVFVSFVLMLVGATVCYKIFLLVHLHQLRPGACALPPPLPATTFLALPNYFLSWFC